MKPASRAAAYSSEVRSPTTAAGRCSIHWRKRIGAQAELVDILAEFHPRIVRMAGAVEVDPEEGN